MNTIKINFRLFSVLILAFSSNLVWAQQRSAEEKPFMFRDDASLYVGIGFNEMSKLNRVDVGIDAYPPGWVAGLYGDFGVLLDAEALSKGQDALWGFGVSLGIRSSLGWVIEPYIGGGIFLGINGDSAPAEDDNIDNDEDGAVDEDGELKTISSGIAAGAKGELGVRARLGVLRLLVAYQGIGISTNGGQGSEAGLFIAFGIGPNFFK